jgi:hypothetical protein
MIGGLEVVITFKIYVLVASVVEVFLDFIITLFMDKHMMLLLILL